MWCVSASLGSENSKGEECAEACSHVSWFGQAGWNYDWKSSKWHCQRGSSGYLFSEFLDAFSEKRIIQDAITSIYTFKCNDSCNFRKIQLKLY